MTRETQIRIARWLGGVLLVIVVLVALLHTPPARRFALKQAIQILSRQGVRFDASRLNFNLLALEADLSDVVVQSPQTLDLPPVFRADRAYLNLGLRRLLRGGFYVETASIANPRVHVVVDAAGRSNIPQPPKKDDQPQSELDYLIDSLTIRGGSVRFEDRRQQIDAELPIRELTVDGNPATGNHDVRLVAETGGAVRFQTRQLTVTELTADTQLRDNAVEVRSLRLGLGDSVLAFSGTLNNFRDPRFDVKANTNLSLAALSELAGVRQRVAGTVNATLAARGPVQDLVATASINGDNLTLDRFDKVDLKSELTYRAADSRLRADSLNIVSPSAVIRGTADVALNNRAGASRLNLTATRIDLARLSRMFELPSRIASTGEARIEGSWPALEFARASGAATVRLTPARRQASKDLLPVRAAINVQARGDRITADIAQLEALNATVRGHVSLVKQSALAGDLRIQAPRIAETVSSAEAFLGKTLLGTPVAGAATIDAKLSGTRQSPVVDASINAPDVSAGQLTGIAVVANATYDPRQLTLREMNVQWREQSLAASGTVGLRGRTQPLDMSVATENVQIESILAGLNRTGVPAKGSVGLNARITGTTKQPEAQATLQGSNLEAYGETLGELNARVTLRDQVATIEQLSLTKPQPGDEGTLRGTGWYNLETKDYRVDLRSENLQLTNLTLPDGKAVRGTMSIDAEGSGNVNDPAAKVVLEAGNLRVGDTVAGDVRLTANTANQIADVKAAADRYKLTADARIGTSAPYPATFTVNASGTDLASLPVEMKEPVSGTVNATIRGSAELQNPRQAQANAEIAQLNLDWRGNPIRSEGPIRLGYANERLTIESATLLARDSRVELAGNLPVDPQAGAGELRLNARLDLPTLMDYVPSETPFSARGTATIEGAMRGTLKQIDPELTVSLRDGYLYTDGLNPPIENAELRAVIQNGTLNLESAEAAWGTGRFTASATVPFGLLPPDLPVELPRGQGPASVTAELRDIDLTAIEQLPETVFGRVSARLEAQAPEARLEAVTGRLTFPELRAGLKSFAVEQQGVSEIRIANGTAQVTQFRLTGPGTDVSLNGTAGLTGQRVLNLQASGSSDLSIVGAFAEDIRAQGPATFEVDVTGNAQRPEARGFLELADANVSISRPRMAAEGLNARIDFSGTQATVSRLNGSLNGGTLTGGGTVEYAGGLRNVNLDLNLDEVYLDFPEGLKTVSDVKAQIRTAGDNIVVGGEVVIEEGGFTDDLDLDRGILAALTSPEPLDLTQERNPLVEDARLNVAIRTANPLIIENNLAEAEVTADLRLLGTPYEPGLAGRLNIEEGSRIRLQERDYTVDRGVITFTNERKIEPGLDILATTTAEGFDISLQITGQPGDTETTLTSDPPLSEPEILAILLTGRTLDEIRGQEFDVARNQVLSYLTGRVGGVLGRGIAGATGLSMVRIEPSLIANEADPSARLTVGQDITRNLELIYSMDLVNSSDQIYVVEYDVTKRFTSRGVRQSDGSLRMDFRHDLRFGGIPEPRRGARRDQRRIGDISILGSDYFTPERLREKLKVKSGSRYDYFKVRKGLDRIDSLLKDERLLESRLRLRRQQEGSTVNLNLQVQEGPRVSFVFEGISVPGDVRERIEEIWAGGVFDTQRAEESIEALRAWLVEEDYLRPEIEYSISNPAEREKRVLFDIQPGVKFHDVKLVFEGASGIEQDKLRDIVEEQKLATEVYTAPDRVTDLLVRYYREMGFLDAEIDAPNYVLDAKTRSGDVIFAVREGPLYRVGDAVFQGNRDIDTAQLSIAVPLPKGEPFRPALRENALDRIRQVYWNQGYNDVDTQIALQRSPQQGTVDLVFRITENRRTIVDSIVIEGNQNTSQNLVQTQLKVKPGEPLNLQALGESRRNLYNTGAYSLVEIAREDTNAETDPERRVRLRVQVREIQPFQLNYGAFYDTERGVGLISDFSNRNTLGSARVIGLRTRWDSQLREARIYFTQPQLLRFPVRTIVSPYVRRELNPETADTDPFNVDRLGFSVQQEANLWRNYLLNYGFRWERSRTYDTGLDPIFDISTRINSFTAALTRETRDELLDATRGSFMSHALEISPEILGSDLGFIKYFGQYFRYFPLQKERVELFTNRILRPRLVYATGLRVGLSTGFGDNFVPRTERFFAGGSNTLRGFEQNAVGRIDGRTPLGGEAMVVLNNEIRAPLFSVFDGVGFVDVGNVYPEVSNISLGDLRKTAGIGLRMRTPWFLLRLDYGLKLDRRPGESAGRLFFSIGQAF